MRTFVPVVAIALLSLAACREAPPEDRALEARPAPVRTAPAESVALTSGVRAVGLLAPRDELRLSFKVGGVIETLAVEAGDRVQAGQVLAVLKRAEVDAAVAQASEGVEKARRDLERARQLQVDEVATEEQVENLTTAYNVARANLRAAEFNARFARIEAPADGIVLQRLARASELVQGGQPVLVLGATDEGWIVRVGLADRDAVRVEAGDAATVAFDAFPGREFPGRVARIGSSADPYTGTFEVEVDVVPEGARFGRGLVARVSIELAGAAAPPASTVVPVTAVVEANGPAGSVYVLDAGAGVARLRPVTLGAIVDERVIVLEGLEPGETVVTDGAAWLSDGRAVQVVSGAG
jgi:RND family efflux transporter MFP subunit